MTFRLRLTVGALFLCAAKLSAQCPPPAEAPRALTPDNQNVTASSSIMYSWVASSASGVTGYDAIVAATGGSGSIACSSTGTSCTAAAPTASGRYNWIVRARIAGCVPGLDSPPKGFTVGCPIAAPTTQTPAMGASNVPTTVTLTWTPVADADLYDIFLGTAGTCVSTTPAATSTTTSFTPPTLQPDTAYEWRVVARKSGSTCPGQSSACATFRTAPGASCPNAAATLIAPAAGSRVDSASAVTFSWSSVTNAVSYDVMLSSDAGATFTSIATVPPTTTTTSRSLAAGGYIWFVRTNYDAACPPVGSSRVGFTVGTIASNCPNVAPTLVAPSNGAANVPSPVLFDWNAVAGATFYRLMASFNGGAASPVTITRDTEYSTNVPAGSVEWWVDTLTDNCQTLGSPHFRFTAAGATTCPTNPGTPTLASPAGGASVSSPVTFTWSSVTGANSYRVWASINNAVPVILGGSSATTLTTQVPQGTVLWYVEARFDGCPSTFSARQSFSVTSPTVCNNAPATLIAPANNATDVASPVTFRWNAVPGAIGYRLFVAASGAAPNVIAVTTETSATRLVPQGTLTWWVDTAFAGCRDEHSAELRFTVGSASSCGNTITLTAPANGATVGPLVTFTWSAVPGASAYRLWASVNGGPAINLSRTTATTATVPVPSGTIDWQVEVLFDACPPILSTRNRFTVTAATNCDTHRAVTLAAPGGGAQLSNPIDFSWTATDTTASLYRVWVSIGSDPFVDIGVTRETRLKHDIPPGSAQWYVESFFEGCAPLASAKASFTVQPPPRCANETPLLIAPADGAATVTAPVTLVWSSVPNVTEYRVFAFVGTSDPVLVARTSGTSITKTLIPGVITWWVQAEFDSCPVTTSTRSRFTIPRAATCDTQAPQLISPADGSTNLTSPVTLDWNPVSGAVGYLIIARHNGGSPTRIGETRDTQLIRRMPAGSIEWWVIAFFAGCPPQEAIHARFDVAASACDTRSPMLMSPPDGAAGLDSSVRLAWSAVPRATSYKVWASFDDQGSSVLASTTSNSVTVSVPAGTVEWYVEAQFDNCPTVASATSTFSTRRSSAGCPEPAQPVARVAGQVASGTAFTIHWTAVSNAANYELLESTSASFTGATPQVIADVSTTLTRTTGDQPTRYYYRVRALSNCSEVQGLYSTVVSVVVVPQRANQQRQTTIDVAAQNAVTQQIVLPGQDPPVSFSARADKPWITVTPASGTLGPAGVTLNVTYDPAALKLGTNTGTVILTFGSSGGKFVVNAVTPVVPVSISLVTPVAPGGKNTPPPDSLIIPAVGHAPGANNSLFESDVRVANTSAQIMKYQLNFTLTGSDGTRSGQSSTISVDPGSTMALDDILTNFFGIGSDGGSATGVLEIRPLTPLTSSGSGIPSVQTVASSRTYNTTPTGTFGQFIPAIPFAQFIGKSAVLSLQQVAQSTAYRTNVGLVEAAAEPADVVVRVFDNRGLELKQIPLSLMPGEHRQINNFLQANGITLEDGRLEVEVTSTTGKVTAYASVVDNITNDPLLVFPVLKGGVSSTRYVLPGVGDFDVGVAHWKSDVRLFNASQAQVPVMLTYYPQNDAAHPLTFSTTLQGGEVRAVDNLIGSLFPSALLPTAGSLAVSSSTGSVLVATARTYTQTTSGTYGQFIPAVTPASSVGNAERSLQLLQLESSDRFRTNIGLAETSGSAATVRVSLILPDSKFAINTEIPLAANEFKQFSLNSFGAGTVYNGRVTVSVISGTGRVTAYGSVIDQFTQDPTYVPAQ